MHIDLVKGVVMPAMEHQPQSWGHCDQKNAIWQICQIERIMSVVFLSPKFVGGKK
jgi:hypothetical protein